MMKSTATTTMFALLLALTLTHCAPTAAPPTTLTPTISLALATDAQRYAADHNLPLAEAERRLQLQALVGNLNGQLLQHEAATFAGLWWEHAPEFRLVAQFTGDGRATLERYLPQEFPADLVDVRSASLPLAELEAIQASTMAALYQLDIPFNSGINLFDNVVEFYVVETATAVTEMLREAQLSVSAQVRFITLEPVNLDPATPPLDDAPADIYFFQHDRPAGVGLAANAAELVGQLILVDGCLRVQADGDEQSSLVVWPSNFALGLFEGELVVRNEVGQLTYLGEAIKAGGGEFPARAAERQMRDACAEPYFAVHEGWRSVDTAE